MNTSTATENTYTAFAAALGCTGIRDERDALRRVNSCLAALGCVRSCPRCYGSGHFSRNSYGSTTCYTCDGRGQVVVKITAKVVAEAAKVVAAGELDGWRAANRANAAAKRAIAPIMAVVDEEWKNGAVHTAHKNDGDAWRVLYPSLNDYPAFNAAGLINSAHDLAASAACQYRSKGMTGEQRLAAVNEALAAIREINAAFAQFIADERAAQVTEF
jgi:hypothetical protein